MIFITTPASKMEESNQWVRDNVDPQGTTFIENFVGECLISIVDDGSDYSEKMKEHFGYTEDKPNLTPLGD